MIDSMKRLVSLGPEQIQRLVRGETIVIVPAKENHRIVLDTDKDQILTAEYVPVPTKLETLTNNL